MRKKVLLITEYLYPPYDEGIKKTAYNIFSILNRDYDLQVICREGPENISNIRCISSNKLFICRDIKTLINNFKPDVVIYFPFASSTFAGFIRNYILSSYYRKAKNIIIALQPKPLKFWQQWLIKFIQPDILLTPSPLLKSLLDDLKINNRLLPLYTNLEIFIPINADQKRLLRKKYNIPNDVFVITHTGHLNEGRNLKSLISLQGNGNQVLIVGSTSTPSDAVGPASLKDELEKSGIKVIGGHIENIEEIYQLSDLYIFPVIKPNSSIGLPLSILEARGCGIPVMTTDYGSTRYFLGDDSGSIFYCAPEEFIVDVNRIKSDKKDYLSTAVKELNEKFNDIIHEEIKK